MHGETLQKYPEHLSGSVGWRGENGEKPVSRHRTRIIGAGHVRYKESDRLGTVAAGIRALGGRATVEGDELRVDGGSLRGGVVNAAGDHRLVLAFGVLGLCVPGVRIRGAEAVGKSYPGFLRELVPGNRGGAPCDE